MVARSAEHFVPEQARRHDAFVASQSMQQSWSIAMATGVALAEPDRRLRRERHVVLLRRAQAVHLPRVALLALLPVRVASVAPATPVAFL